MERRQLQQLYAWKRNSRRKPLVVRGARQVGKTWLLQHFGAEAYERVAYVNFQRQPSLGPVFDGDLDPARIIRALEVATGTSISDETTLLILDEVQEAPVALTALKYLAEERPDLHVAAAGSLLGVAVHASTSFPVGKVNFLDLHPLDFDEFLRGTGDQQLADALIELDWDLVSSLHGRLVERLRSYLYVGGMPEVVSRYAAGATPDDIRAIQREILTGYEADFAKYADAHVSRQIAQVWASLPAQLAREQRRFVFGHVRAGGRARQFEDAIQWLEDAGLVHRVTRTTKPAHPPRSYEDRSIFKLYLHDVGLLGAMAELDPAVLLDQVGIFEEFKGALTEQYVLQQIVARGYATPMYWTPDKPTAEVDFLLSLAGGLVPIEVKAAENLRSKSLRSYIDRHAPTEAWRFSLSPYREQDDLVNVPLPAVGAWIASRS